MASTKKIITSIFGRISPELAEHVVGFVSESYVAYVHSRFSRKCLKTHRDSKGLRLNIGCGASRKDGFLNLDFVESADFRLDLRKPLPLPDGSCSELFSEHFVEHLSYPEGGEQFFKECYRVLEPGGRIRLSVPDTTWPLATFRSEKNDWLALSDERNWHPDWCTTYVEHLNFHFRQRGRGLRYSHFENHRFAWDYETMEKKLSEAGFQSVSEREFEPEFDAVHRKDGSLFVTAMK